MLEIHTIMISDVSISSPSSEGGGNNLKRISETIIERVSKRQNYLFFKVLQTVLDTSNNNSKNTKCQPLNLYFSTIKLDLMLIKKSCLTFSLQNLITLSVDQETLYLLSYIHLGLFTQIYPYIIKNISGARYAPSRFTSLRSFLPTLATFAGKPACQAAIVCHSVTSVGSTTRSLLAKETRQEL